MAGLITQQSLGNDQYPKTITEANTVLSNHRFDYAKFKNKNPGNQYKHKPDEQEQEKINISFAQMEGKCYCCGKEGHRLPQCQYKNKPKAEWAINKSQQSYAQANKMEPKMEKSTPASNYKETTQSESEGWAGMHHQLYQQENMKEWILLDNESTVTIFCNPDMVEDIQDMKNESLDLMTNAGILRTT